LELRAEGRGKVGADSSEEHEGCHIGVLLKGRYREVMKSGRMVVTMLWECLKLQRRERNGNRQTKGSLQKEGLVSCGCKSCSPFGVVTFGGLQLAQIRSPARENRFTATTTRCKHPRPGPTLNSTPFCIADCKEAICFPTSISEKQFRCLCNYKSQDEGQDQEVECDSDLAMGYPRR
jgi:hypothetical protein